MSSSYSVLQSIVETSSNMLNKSAIVGWNAGGALNTVAEAGHQKFPFGTSAMIGGTKNDEGFSFTLPSASTTAGLAASCAVGAAAALAAAPAVASALGFTSEGIVAGSTAAGMMSTGAVEGVTSAGSVVSTFQAMGAKSTVFVGPTAVLYTAGVGIAVGAAGYGAYRGYRHYTEAESDA